MVSSCTTPFQKHTSHHADLDTTPDPASFCPLVSVIDVMLVTSHASHHVIEHISHVRLLE